MSKHHPYETWILQDAALNEDEQRRLNAHLAVCQECRQIKNGWQQTIGMLKSAPVKTPEAGFSQRWKNSLADRRARQHAAQIRRFFKIMIGTNLFTFLGLIFTFLLGTSPVNMMASLLRTGVTLIFTLKQVEGFIVSSLNTIPLFIPVFAWILVMTGFCLTALVWGASMWRFLFRGVNTK